MGIVENQFVDSFRNNNVLAEDYLYFQVDWYELSNMPGLPLNLIKKYKDKVNWHCIVREQTLPEYFICEHINYVFFEELAKYQYLSEKFMDKYFLNLNTLYISRYQKLSEKFIESHIDKLNLECIVKYQKVSMNFIEKYIDILNLGYVAENQNLSEQFITHYFEKFHKYTEDLLRNKNLELSDSFKGQLLYLKDKGSTESERLNPHKDLIDLLNLPKQVTVLKNKLKQQTKLNKHKK